MSSILSHLSRAGGLRSRRPLLPAVRPRRTAAAVAAVSLASVLAVGSPATADGVLALGHGPRSAPVPVLHWTACGAAKGVQCASARVPQDYDHPRGAQFTLHLSRVPARDRSHRIGSLFYDFGGPGAANAGYLEAGGAGIFSTLNERFDIVAFDPRGTGQSTPAIDCKADQERQGIYSEPFITPLDVDVDALVAKSEAYAARCVARDGSVLRHVSTANVARDMDLLRQAVGDRRLSYLGFSYGTFLGSTYAALFPHRYRALVLDGPLDADLYIHDPLGSLEQQTAGFEYALGRFFQACARDQEACLHFGGSDPWLAYDRLIERARHSRLPAKGYTADPRPVGGDDVRAASLSLLYSKSLWPLFAQMLATAAKGDGSLVRAVVDQLFYGRNDDGTFTPGLDRYFTIGAAEQQFPKRLDAYLTEGERAWGDYPHFYVNVGYSELSYRRWPARDKDAYTGSFRLPADAVTPLVVATRYDPATPYPGARRLVAELGNARLLTMDGDGHTAYAGNSTCIDTAVERYLFTVALPRQGRTCQQQVPFEQETPARVAAGAGALAPSLAGLPAPALAPRLAPR